jgi:hypothetical protein
MTPKEKAIELIDKMYFSRRYKDEENYIPKQAFIHAKKCALIAVDLAIQSATSFFSQEVAFEKSKEYWYNVKEEIKSIHEAMEEYAEQFKENQIIAKPFFLLGVPKDITLDNFNYLEKYCYEKYTDYNTFIYFSMNNKYEFKILK